MLGIALANRYLLVPKLGSTPYAAAALRAMTLVEGLLSLVAVAAVSFFGLLDPN
jgi:putative copper resistance protein D